MTIIADNAESTLAQCPSCGADAAADWAHCGACGAPLVTASALAQDEPSRPRGSRLIIATLSCAIAVLIVSAIAVTGLQHRVDHARADLRRTRAELTAKTAKLAATENDLKARTTERDESRAQLADIQGQLKNAKSSIDLQGSQIDTLKQCLNDIEAVGEAVDTGDQTKILDAAHTADRSCRKAEALL